MIDYLVKMGPLRNMLHGLAAILMLVLPFSEPAWHPEGWAILLDAVVPALGPIVCVVIMLDVMMCKIWQADSQEAEVKQFYGGIVRAHLVMAAALFAVWFVSLQDGLFL